ncbi:MAG: GNAT family N-acetyltransferase [Caldilineaceae bacterium]|nr:GNAT family N-acetyltransferase [Caldilineaceae bacterium]
MTPSTSISNPLPVGPLVIPIDNPIPPRCQIYTGQFVTLTPVDPAADIAELYAASHGDPVREQLWTYMPYGPFVDQAAMQNWLEQCQASIDPLFLTVTDRDAGQRVGVVSFLNIVASQRRVELGHIWYAPEAQRTKINTESIYLMLCESFDYLHYRRVEWKCDSLNARSRAAALRLGFQYEGIFRQHLIVRGRNRDTAWFAMTDGDWPRIKANLERWLYTDEAGLSLAEMNRQL